MMVWAKILPVSRRAPSDDSVVITASAMTGTATNWKRRVNTVAMKPKSSLMDWLPKLPSQAPMSMAPNQITTLRRFLCFALLFSDLTVSSSTRVEYLPIVFHPSLLSVRPALL